MQQNGDKIAVFFYFDHSAMSPNLPEPIVSQAAYRLHNGNLEPFADTVAEETAVALVYNGISHVVMMCTPQHLHELALGFSLSEGILGRRSECYDIQTESSEHGIAVHLEIAAARFVALKERRRSISGRTGCGLCGIDSLAAALPQTVPVVRSGNIQAAHIAAALAQFDQAQPLRQHTGSLHAAAWVADGRIQAAFEDVGRHNALDKLLGHLAQTETAPQNGFVLLSSRASYEMVAKAAALGIGCIAAVSAPTALAVRIADQAGITLIGYARAERQTVYTHPQYIAS